MTNNEVYISFSIGALGLALLKHYVLSLRSCDLGDVAALACETRYYLHAICGVTS